MNIFDDILRARGLEGEAREAFLNPDYARRHDPFLLPDMQAAVERLVEAREAQEHITIYGDYDIDGLTASTVLIDAFESFGFERVDIFIPNRFVEGYGLTVEAVEKIAATGATLIVTVDCGSLSEREIVRASELGVDVIVTDHHNVAPVQPPAVAVINPKRLLQDHPERYENLVLVASDKTASSATHTSPVLVSARESRGKPRESRTAQPERVRTSEAAMADDAAGDSVGELASPPLLEGDVPVRASQAPQAELRSPVEWPSKKDGGDASEQDADRLYPFLDLPGVGVAFKLVQALQTRLDGLPEGQEKWLLDLVALGTVCDVVQLVDENRMHVYWGLKVLAKTRRPGLKALMAVAKVEPSKVNARSLGFALGPRMNAAGRLETAQIALDMLRATDPMEALALARQLDDMNAKRRADQDVIYGEAIVQAEQFAGDDVLVVSAPGWSHGIIGIVAAKLLEKYGKPTYVLEEMGEEAKGSARSYGDFSAADAIRASDDIITKGGGHKFAAGVTLPTANIAAFRERVNKFYKEKQLQLPAQQAKLLPRADVTAAFDVVTEELIELISTLEPFGNGNPQPIIRSDGLLVRHTRRMGSDSQHVKLELADAQGLTLSMLAFSAPPHFFVEPGERVTVWYQPDVNEWQGRRSVEGRLLHIDIL